MFSKKVLSTDKEKTTLNWWEYWIGHCIATGFQSMRLAFINWTHLMWFEEEQKNYALLKDDDPLEQCILYFWDSLEDETYPKEFLESLMQLSEDVRTGKEKVVPFTQDMFDRIEDLIGDTLETDTEDCLDCD